MSSRVSPIETLDAVILTAAANRFPIDIFAEFVSVEYADEEFDLYINRGGRAFKLSGNDFYRMPLGEDGKQSNFFHLEIRRRADAALASNTVILTVGSGDYRRGRVTLAAVVDLSAGAEVSLAAGTTVDLAAGAEVIKKAAATLDAGSADYVLAAATNTTVAAANANRKRVHFLNNGANPVRLATVDATLTAGRGYLLRAYAETSFEVTGIIKARAAGVTTLVVSEEVY